MRVSREKSEENRQAVIDAAGRMFRERGLDGAALSDLMQAAGLTHGGFYKKFASKEDLQHQAVSAALKKNRAIWTHRIARAKSNPLDALVSGYLSPGHRENVGDGCCLASLGADAARHGDPKLRGAFDDAIRSYLDLIEGILTEQPDTASRNQAATILAGMVGALMLSRLTTDPELSAQFLTPVAEAILATEEG
jgi:Transcriptional regulator